MDFIHACYASTMRPFRDRPDVLVPGRWYFCLPGAKPVPFPHTFSSIRLLPEDQKYDTGDTGEVESLGIVRPDSPARLLGQNVCGDADHWLNGSYFSEQFTLPHDAEGVARCCVSGPAAAGGALCGSDSQMGNLTGYAYSVGYTEGYNS